jgi:hypothetical protein
MDLDVIFVEPFRQVKTRKFLMLFLMSCAVHFAFVGRE